MNTIELSNYTVGLKDAITWGDQEAIKAALLTGVKLKQNIKDIKDSNVGQSDIEFDANAMLVSKYKAIERCVLNIKDKEGKDVSYSKEWLDNLSISDGDKLSAAVDEVTNPPKK